MDNKQVEQDKVNKLPKWAQQYVADLQYDCRIAAAFHRTQPVEKDVDIPERSYDLAKGWLFNSYNASVSKACSSAVHHCPHDDEKTTSQMPRRLFSTKLRALRALRYEVEKESAEKLAKIDLMIEEESER